MDKQKQPGIRIKTIFQEKCIFERKHGKPDAINNNFSFKYCSNLLEDGCGLAELTLISGGIYKDTDTPAYSSEITYIGIFEIEEGLENMTLEEFLDNNAPAILIPYIRESLSSLSIKSGLSRVYLPPINILALMQK